jgi:aminoglycoside phosphotransferase (APT) family kinase protein
MSREHQVLSRLWKEFDLAPRSFALCEDKSLIGAPFFLMERKAGVVVRKKIPAIFGGGDDPATNRKLSEMVIDTLVQFHGVKPDQADLGDLGRPVGFLERQIHGWSQRWDASKLDDIPLVDELRQWLRDKLPTSDRTTLVHNDWRLDNMAVAADDPSRCVAVYDWDMCTQGDPLADLGTLLSVWYDEDEAPASLNPMPTMAEGFITRRQAAERYSSLMNIDTGEVDYYIVFGSFKMAVVLQQIFIRWHRGQTQDERFAAMGEGAMSLFSLAADRRP